MTARLTRAIPARSLIVCRWVGVATFATVFAAIQVHAQQPVSRLTIALEAGRLDAALRKLSAQSGRTLLFPTNLVGGRHNRRVAGTKSVDEFLRLLLDGSGLDYRQTPEGAIIIYALPAPPAPEAMPDILVVGRKTQNSDIRRTENDIQPYQVATSRQITESHADNIDQFLRARLPSDGETQGPSQNPSTQYASNRSEVSLHGLGANQTLILIDGARMPSIPSQLFNLTTFQPDLNGVPPSAVERIETLTGTAGGIYGPGATGGVVNVVLKRDYRGAELGTSSGFSDRGDAARRRIDGSFGFTPDHGETDVMVAVSRSATDSLSLGDRDYAQNARRIRMARDPAGSALTLYYPDGVFARSLSGGDLTLIKSLGGTVLSSSFTYLPLAHPNGTAATQAALVSNSGQLPDGLSPDGNGLDRSLTNSTKVTSLLLNVRHRLGQHVEAFADLIAFQNDSRGTVVSLPEVSVIDPGAPANPFQQAVALTFPLPGFDAHVTNRLRTIRLTAGLIFHLPRSWQADASGNLGGVRSKVYQSGFNLNADFDNALNKNASGAGGEPAPNVFGDWATFVTALQAYKTRALLNFERTSRSRDASLRLAGPVFTTAGGVASLTLLAEHRGETFPVSTYSNASATATSTIFYPAFAQKVSSLYGELRAPIFARDRGPSVLHGLELQLAVRYDSNVATVPLLTPAGKTLGYFSAGQAATAFTAGFRAFPQDHLMLRGSLATGVLPPTPQQLLPAALPAQGPFYGSDPQRGGRLVGTEAPFSLMYGGSTSLRPETATTWSFGLILNPEGVGRPRVALDFTHIRKKDEIGAPYLGNVRYFLTNEEAYPGHVTRAPLTAADMAAGFTGGVITEVDTGAMNIGRTKLDALDIRATYDLRLGVDVVRLYGAATWQMGLARQMVPGGPSTQYVGYSNGPLAWRGNAGMDWERGRLAIGLNGQYYGGYYATAASAGTPDAVELAALDRTGVRIPPQVYFDMSLLYRIDIFSARGPSRSLELRFGIQDLLDHAPSLVTGSDVGYSYYGDPRRRRFEIGIVTYL